MDDMNQCNFFEPRYHITQSSNGNPNFLGGHLNIGAIRCSCHFLYLSFFGTRSVACVYNFFLVLLFKKLFFGGIEACLPHGETYMNTKV